MCIALSEVRSIVAAHADEILPRVDSEALLDAYFSFPDETRQAWYDELDLNDEDEIEDDVEDTEDGLELSYVETLPVREYAF